MEIYISCTLVFVQSAHNRIGHPQSPYCTETNPFCLHFQLPCIFIQAPVLYTVGSFFSPFLRIKGGSPKDDMMTRGRGGLDTPKT